MTYYRIYYLCLAAFGVLAVASVYGYLRLWTAEPEFVVEESEQTLAGLTVDREYVVDFRVLHRGSRTLRVVGAEYS